MLLCSKAIPVAASWSTNWAEAGTDTEIDLVNSLRFTFHTVGTAGNLSAALLATDRAAAPAPPAGRRLIGVWDCTSTAAFATFDVECRYDHVAAAGQPVMLFRWDAGLAAWVELGNTELSAYRVQATGIAPLGAAKIGLLAAAVATSATVEINNDGGPADVTDSSAALRGELVSQGGSDAYVTIYWGTNDGGTVTGAWMTNAYLGRRPEGTFQAALTGLTASQTYYYRCYASNSASTNWAPSSTNFLTSRPVVSLGVTGSPLDENGGVATVTAALGTVSASNVTVNLAFAGDAVRDTDYAASAAQIVIPAGSRSGAVTLTGLDDPDEELAETATVSVESLANAVSGTVVQVSAIVADDDGGLAVSNDDGPTAVTAAAATLRGTLERDAGAPAQVWIYWGTSDGDTVAGNWQTNLALGARAVGPFSADVAGLLANGSYYYRGYASNATGTAWAPATTSFVALPPAVSLGLSGSPFAETGGVATVTATLSSVSAVDVEVFLAFAGVAVLGTDYAASTGRIVIAAGSLSGQATLKGLNDATIEGTEALSVGIGSLVNGVVGASASVAAAIADDDYDARWDRGAGTYDWFSASNWNPDGVPTRSAHLNIEDSTTEATPVVISNASQTARCYSLLLPYAAGQGHVRCHTDLSIEADLSFRRSDGSFRHVAGTVRCGSMNIGSATSGGTRRYRMESADATLLVGGNVTMGGGTGVGLGQFIQSNGTAVVGGTMSLGSWSGTGIVELCSGSLTVSNQLRAGYYGTGAGSVRHTGGTLNVGAGGLSLGDGGARGDYEISGPAELNVAGTISLGGTEATPGYGTLRLRGGGAGHITAAGYVQRSIAGDGRGKLDVRIGPGGVIPIRVNGNVSFASGAVLSPTNLPGAESGTYTVMTWSGSSTDSGLTLYSGSNPRFWSFQVRPKSLTVTYKKLGGPIIVVR